MLRGGLRTKEGKILAVILGSVVIIVGGCAYAGYSHAQQFLEQAVMAENYLNSGSYEQAIEAYEKALSMKNSDEQLLTIGLADAYVGISNYNKALEVLRACYTKTSGTAVIKKIEEVSSEKADYEYLQSISHAEVYYSNQEYQKAIDIYESAKLIKSQDPTAYQRIAEAYIKLEKYDLAREEVLEGLEITRESSLQLTLETVDSYIKRDDYNSLIEQAAQYICQENYKDGIAAYGDAIAMLPKVSEAYIGLAQTYIDLEEYDNAVLILQNAVKVTDSVELTKMLKQARKQQEREEEITNVLNSLCSALESRNTTAVTAIMKTDFFKQSIAVETPVYYNIDEETNTGSLTLVIYDTENIYYGDIVKSKKKGAGIYFMLTEGNPEDGYYYYDGEWQQDLPNGTGKTVEMKISTDLDGLNYISRIQTEGTFIDAAENGRMIKYFYVQGKETEKLIYTAQEGMPIPLSVVNSQPLPTPVTGSYVIGILSIEGEPTEEYYSVESQTIWGVKPFITGN